MSKFSDGFAHVFFRHKDPDFPDLSIDLRDPDDWLIGSLRSFDLPLNVSALAVEPLSGLLAVGTETGFVLIIGSPGVELKLNVQEQLAVRFLHFAAWTYKLLCLDEKNQLHVWDLTTYGQPHYVAFARFDPISFISLSPSHSHAFLSLNSGEIKTYDLECLRKSPYTVPNMWKLYEDARAASGESTFVPTKSHSCVETAIHPRDLNLLLVAYTGGIILCDLSERNTVSSYEHVLPPGAPGGAGYGGLDILMPRKPEVTAIAFHPAGHFFVAGYADGSFAFWAIEDSTRPLLVRTLDSLDVNTIDPDALDAHVSGDRHAVSQETREPIFKLSWSGFPNSNDPRGGRTCLSILGGLSTGKPPGLTTFLLPPFNPDDPPKSPSFSAPELLHPHMRKAMIESINPSDTFFYYTRSMVQDYLLIPRNNPHFSGNYDPIGILMLIETDDGFRTVEAYEFPPPAFRVSNEPTEKEQTPPAERADNPLSDLSETLSSTLHSLQIDRDPRRLKLAPCLDCGNAGLVDGQLLQIPRNVYEILVADNKERDDRLLLRGGLAWADESRVKDLKISKFQPHRILVTHQLDLSVQFHDVSAQLLAEMKPNPLRSYFPNPLYHLALDIQPLLMDPFITQRKSLSFIDIARIHSVYLSMESLETAVLLNTGDIVFYHSCMTPRKAGLYRVSPEEDIILLDHIPTHIPGQYAPHFMLIPGQGSPLVCAVCEIGLVAVSYDDDSLLILNMTVPQVILRYKGGDTQQNRNVASLHLGHLDPPGPLRSLIWTLGPIKDDPRSLIRLIALSDAGSCLTFTLNRSPSSETWTCHGPVVSKGVPHPLNGGGFVIDNTTGESWFANRQRLNMASLPRSHSSRGALIAAGDKGARCYVDINGERLAKIEWGPKVERVEAIEVIERLNSHALVVLTKTDILIYSLPYLEHIHKFDFPLPNLMSITIEPSGDFIVWRSEGGHGKINQATYFTLFNVRRAYGEPEIDLLCTKPAVPPQPQPIPPGHSSLLGSWFRFGHSMTGAQVDSLLGGPDRPVPEPEPLMRYPAPRDIMAGASGITAAAEATKSNLYNRLTSALSERGEMLGELENKLSALEEGSRDMVAQAKRLAAQQTRKHWLGF